MVFLSLVGRAPFKFRGNNNFAYAPPVWVGALKLSLNRGLADWRYPSGVGLVGDRGPTNPCVAEVGKVFLSMILSDSEKNIFGRKNLVSKDTVP